jgi:DNA-binding NtrC family response regulator
MQPAHVLVVDDDPAIREMLRAALEIWDIPSIVVDSAREALAQIVVHPELRMVLTDINMPAMSGLELSREIRRMRDDLPVVAITGMPQDPEEVDEAFDQVLHKPLRLHTLEGIVRAALEDVPARR